jgi:pimeloyl-ACP methyl ester carboxylesterase
MVLKGRSVPNASSTALRPGRELAYPSSRFERLAGIEVHYEMQAPTSTESSANTHGVLFSHHFYGSAPTWRHVMDGLADDHLVAAFDRPGFGLTERLPRSRWNGANPYTRDTSARIGWELLDHLGVRDAVLVGSSAGGTNVLEMYRQQPGRVRGLVLVSPAITGDVGPPSWLRPLLRSPQARALAPRIAQRLADDVSAARIGRSWHDPSLATDAHAEPYQRMLQVEGWEQGFWDVISAEPPPDLRDVLRSIDVPTLLAVGASDRIIAPRWNRRTAGAITDARFEVIPDCGHTPQEECPDALLDLLRPFVDELADETR